MPGKMKKLNTYIVEKLVIDNKVKVKHKDTFKPKEFDDVKLIDVFGDHYYKGYDWYETAKLADSARNKYTCVRLWLALMFKTNSTPYIYNQTIHSYPGNFGIELVEKAIEKFGMTNEEIMDEFNRYNDKEEKELPKELEKLFYQRIESYLNMIIPKSKQNIELKYYIPNGDFYSKTGKKFLDDNASKKMIVMPFEVEYNGKRALCEIAYNVGNSKYYHFRTNNKDFMWSQDFLDELKKVLNI